MGIEAKSYATVIDTDGEQNRITVKSADGQFVAYDPARLRGVTLYEPQIRAFAEGERVQFASPWQKQGISNRDLGTITHLDEHGDVCVKLDGSEHTVSWT